MHGKINENFDEEFSEFSGKFSEKFNENQTEKFNRNFNKNQNRLIQDIKEELYHQTLTNDVSEFSPKKVEYLVGLLDMEDTTDEQEIDKAQKKFEEFFQHKVRRKIQLNRIRKYRKRVTGACVVLVILFITADVTTKAVMDESLFHMVGRWKDQIEIIPGKSVEKENEISDFHEENAQHFDSNEELAEVFGDDFLVCTWLPEGMELRDIFKKDTENFTEILWEYFDNSINDCNIEVWIYRATDNDTAGVASRLGENIYKEKIVNGREIFFYKIEEGNLAGFEYHGWCYMIDTSADEKTFDSILEGMVEYETNMSETN